MGTTILRFAKIKNVANIRQAGAHQHRHHKNTPNANPQLNKLNRYFHGTNNLAADVKGRLEILDKEPRKNSVLAMEGLLQLSPELIKPDGKEDIEVLREWYKQSKEWLNNEFGDNLVNAVLHRDE
ncbi:plasmid recombination protein, partial [Vibrio parahaemolyticus]|nr:plasmid recombination protein [Vibrio parahaemolyticus]